MNEDNIAVFSDLANISNRIESKIRQLTMKHEELKKGLSWTSQESRIKEAGEVWSNTKDYISALKSIYEVMAFLIPLDDRPILREECRQKINSLTGGGIGMTFEELKQEIRDNGYKIQDEDYRIGEVIVSYNPMLISDAYKEGEWMPYHLTPKRISRPGIDSTITKLQIEFLQLVKEYYFGQ